MIRPALLLLLVLAAASSVQAQGGPFFEPDALAHSPLDLRVTAAYHDAERSDFTRPVFLIAQPLANLHMHEFLLQADLRLRLTPALALQLVVPVLWRELRARSYGLQVSRQQLLAGRSVSLSSAGLGDPLLGLAYRFLRAAPWAAYAELGSTFPVDDNPGSSIVPTRVPLSTGQHLWFAGLGGSLERPVRLSASYRFGYSPGEHATYLIRRVGTQSFTNGAFAPFLTQSAWISAELAPWPVVALRAALGWTGRQWPELIGSTGNVRLLRERWSHELNVAAAVRVQVAAGHRIELRGELPIVPVSDVDPFFPIVVPARGVSITWLVGS
jgi:hypothetical protein